MAEFKSYTKVPGFNPRSVVDTASQISAQERKRMAQVEQAFNSRRQVDQQIIEDTRFVGQDLEALAGFSKSLQDYYEKVAKQDAKNKEIGDQYDALYKPDLDLTPEQEALVVAAAENKYYGMQANDLEAAGLVEEAERVRQDEMKLARGVNNEKALLYNARATYASDIQALVAEPGLSELYQQDPGAALEIATRIWMENNGLQYTTKSNFVKILGPTIQNTNQYLATNATSARLKEIKDETLRENDRQAFNSVNGITPLNSVERYQELSDSYLEDNNGIVTRAGANYRAAEMMLKAAEAKSEDAVNVVLGAQIRPGEEKTSLSDTYPTLASGAVERARDKSYQNMLAKRRAVTTNLGEALKNAKTEQERREAISTALTELGNDIEGRTALQSKYESYVATEDQFAALQKDLSELSQGKVKPPQEVQRDVAQGRLSRAGGQEYITELNRQTKVGQDAVTDVTKTGSLFFANRFAGSTGIAIDPNSGIAIFGSAGLITRNKYSQIRQAYQVDLKRHLKTALYTKLKFDGTQSPAEQEAIIQLESEQFYKDNVVAADGKYNFDGLLNRGDYTGNEEDYARSVDKLNAFGSSVVNRNAAADRVSPEAKDLSTQWGKDYTTLGTTYKAGDNIYTLPQLQSITKTVTDQGISDKGLIQFAKKNGVTPLQVINDSAAFHSEPPITPLSQQEANKLMGLKDVATTDPRYKASSYKAIPAFLAAGYTPQGAAAAVAFLTQGAIASGNPVLQTEDYVKLFENLLKKSHGDSAILFFKRPQTTQKQLIPFLGNFSGSWATEMSQLLTPYGL